MGATKIAGAENAGRAFGPEGIWEADRLYLDHVGKDTFYGLLASLRGRLFRDADFALRWDRGELALIDPATGRRITTFEDERARADSAEARVRELEAENQRLRGG